MGILLGLADTNLSGTCSYHVRQSGILEKSFSASTKRWTGRGVQWLLVERTYIRIHTHILLGGMLFSLLTSSKVQILPGGPFLKFSTAQHFNMFLRKVLQIDCRSVVPPGEATECKDCAALL